MIDLPALDLKSGVYKIVNTLDGKFYVGSSKNLKKRLSEHIANLRKSRHANIKLQNAWDKYGDTAFRIEIIEYVELESKLLEREQFWLDELACLEKGYNLLPVAGSPLGYKHTDEAKQKLVDYNTGRVHSEDTKRKISESAKGRKHTEETRKKISEAKKINGTSPETIDKIRKSNTGKKRSEQAKKNIGNARRGKKHSEETKQKLRESALRRSEEKSKQSNLEKQNG